MTPLPRFPHVCCLVARQALKVDTMTSLIDERDREVHNIVASINELGQVGWGCGAVAGGSWGCQP